MVVWFYATDELYPAELYPKGLVWHIAIDIRLDDMDGSIEILNVRGGGNIT